MQRFLTACLAALGLASGGITVALAEVPDVKIVAQNGTNYLPLFVMQGRKRVEKHLEAKGLKSTTVTWARLSSPAAIVDSFLAGAVAFCRPGCTVFSVAVGPHPQRDRCEGGVGTGVVEHLADDPQA